MAHFDDILKDIGERGYFQIILLLLLSLAKFFAAFQTVGIVFTGGKMDYTCVENLNTFAESMENQCDKLFVIGNRSASNLMDANSTQYKWLPCDNWTFNSTSGYFISSWRQKFNLVCHRQKLVDISSSVFMAGFLIGATAYGILSDKCGRMIALLIASCNVFIFGLAMTFSPNVEAFIAFRFIVALGASGLLCVCNAFISESVSAKYRLTWVLIGTNGWNVAMCVVSLLAFLIRDRFLLDLAFSTPAIIGVAIALYLGESPRWLFVKKYKDRAMKQCKRIARVNRKPLPDRFEADIEDMLQTLEHQKDSSESNLWDLLKSSSMRRPTILVWMNFFTGSLMYYGIIFFTGKIKGNIYLIFLIGSAVGIPASLTAIMLANRIGRPLFFVIAFFTSAVCLIICAFLFPVPGTEIAVIIIATIGRFFSTWALDASWAYSGEIFPTVVRNAGMGSASTAARVGGILAPLINMLSEYWKPLPFLIFGAISIVTSITALWLPETKNKFTPETLEDADHEYSKPKIDSLKERFC